MISEHKAKHNHNYQAYIHRSSILFTAPHSKSLKRGKPEQHIQDHHRQAFTAFLAVKLAKATGNNSFMIWKATNEISANDLDPNYLSKEQFKNSPFHQSLHYWAQSSPNTPLLHIDIHGKENRSQNCHIDIGIRSMEVHWKNDNLDNHIKHFFKEHGDIFSEYKFGQFRCQFNTAPKLDGHWGTNVHTMTQQAVLLGIPSFQMEIPFAVRKMIFEDKVLRARFQSLIKQLYESVIVPDFKHREARYNIHKETALHFEPNVSKDQIDEVTKEIISFENNTLAKKHPK